MAERLKLRAEDEEDLRTVREFFSRKMTRMEQIIQHAATILANLSASNITIGKARYRKDLCASHSGRAL